MNLHGVGAAVLAALVAVSLAACGGDDEPNAPGPDVVDSAVSAAASGTIPAPAPAEQWGDPRPAAAAGKAGPGTACPVPFAFDLAAKWQAKDVSSGGMEAKGYTLRCEIDGKPAGVIGFIRVWAGTSEPKAGLESFLPVGATDARYRQVGAADRRMWEVSYEADGEPKRAFALPGLLVEWGGLDAEEHANGLPAYVLARDTIRAA